MLNKRLRSILTSAVAFAFLLPAVIPSAAASGYAGGFECENVPVYSDLALSKKLTPNVQNDAAASGGKIAGITGGRYFLFSNVTEANCIKLAYASPNTNSINVWLRYPGEDEMRPMPSIPFSTSNSWTMDSSASYIASSSVFYIPAGSDIVLRPNVDCNLDKMWLVYENNVTSDSAPADTVAADKISADVKTDLMAPYGKALELKTGQSVTVTVPDVKDVYNVITLSYTGDLAELEFSVDGKQMSKQTFDKTAYRTYKTSGIACSEFKKGDKITLKCTNGDLSIGYVSFNYAPAAEKVQISLDTKEESRHTVCLDGIWAFESEAFGEWSVDDTVSKLAFVNSIPVPGLWSSAAIDEGENAGHKAWYKKTIALNSEPKGNVTLYIEQAQYSRYVYVNGRLADSYEYNYSASYSDITGLLHKGDNEIVIMLGDFSEQFNDKNCKAHILYDGESRYDMPGITGSVKLIFNEDPVVSKVQTNPDVKDGTLDVQITLSNSGSESVKTDVTVTVYELGVYKDGKPEKEVKAADVTKKNVTVTPGENDAFLIKNIKLENWSSDKCWTPDNPYLYRVEIKTSGDTYKTRIGMRTIGYDKATKYYTLNGKPLYLRGTNVALERYYDDPLCGTTPWQKDWVRKLYSEYKDVNWFCFRAHLGNLNELWFDLADEMGFFIIDEYPQWGDSDGCTIKTIMPEIYRWMDLRVNHPSLFMFDAQNEATGTTFTDDICRLGRKYDLQNRTWDNGWRPPVFDDSPVECHPYFLDGKGVSGIKSSKYKKPTLTMANIGWTCETYPDHPFILNEHGEIWVSRDGIPMSGTAGNWNTHLPKATQEQRLTYYADVMSAQMEAFRSYRAYSGLLFFCGLCSDFPDHKGITCDILSPDVSNAKTLQIRPEIKDLLRCAFAKLGIVTDYNKETCRRGEEISVPVKLINDTGADVSDLTVTLTVLSGDTVLYADKAVMSVEKFSSSNDGLSSHTFNLTVPSYAGYCDNGKILYLVSSYTQNGETVYSRRKLTVKGGGESVTDTLPEYDWLTEAPETGLDTQTDTETEPEASSAVVTETAEMETDPKENNHKVHPAVIAAIIVAAAAVAAAALIIGIRMKKKGS